MTKMTEFVILLVVMIALTGGASAQNVNVKPLARQTAPAYEV